MRGRADYEGVDVPKVTAAAAALLLVLALAGCGDDSQAGDASAKRTVGEQSVEPTPPPLTAEPSEPDAAEADERFLAYVETERPADTSIANATDEQLIAAGHEACEQIAAGVAYTDLRLVEGERPSPAGDYLDTSAIFNGALYNYCPELIKVVD